MKILLCGVIWIATLLPVTVSASVIYTFGNGGDGGASHTVSVDGLTVLVSGYDTDYNAATDSGTTANINRHANGWGIQTDPADHRIGLNEAMVFDWAVNTVSLLSGVVFERGGAPIELFDLYVDGTLILDDFAVTPDVPGNNFVSLDMSSFAISGSRFAFVGQTPIANGDGNQGIRIQQLEVALVSEPSILVLMSMTLLGLGVVRHRTRD